MRVSRSMALDILEGFGYSKDKSEKRTDDEIGAKLGKLNAMIDEDTPPVMDKQLKEVVDDILLDIDNGKEITVVPDRGTPKVVAEAEPQPNVKESSDVKTKKAPEKKPTKKPEKKEKKERAPVERVGIVSAILDCLQKTSKSKPTTRGDILEHLIKKFPGRDAKGMKHTVDVQLNYPKYSNLMKKGHVIKNTDMKDYWLDKNGVHVESNGKVNGVHKSSVKTKSKAKVKAKA